MTTMLNDFGAFLDSLRKSRNMSREEFIDGIISLRQYQRYVNGESSLNNEKLFKLIDKLGMNYFNVHKLYFNNSKDALTKLNNIYGEISRDNIHLASELFNKISKNELRNEYSILYYNLCELLLFKKTRKMPEPLITEKLKKLINYPDCLKNKIINFVEYVAFIHISSYSSENYDDTRILNYLYDKIKNDNISTDTILLSYMPSTYAHVARRLGIINEFEKSLSIAQKGIDWCLKYENHNSLAHLFMYKAFSLKNLNREEDSLLSVKKAFALLFIEDKEHKTKKFTLSFENNFNMKVSEL